MSEYPPEGSFAEWCEQPIRNSWRDNLDENELDRLDYYVETAKEEHARYEEYPTVVTLVAKMSKLLDALTRLNERTEAQRMELIMNTKEQT